MKTESFQLKFRIPLSYKKNKATFFSVLMNIFFTSKKYDIMVIRYQNIL